MCVPQAGPLQGPQTEQVKEKPRDVSVVKREEESCSYPSLEQVGSSPTSPAEGPSPAGTCHVNKAASEKAQARERGHRSPTAASAPPSAPDLSLVCGHARCPGAEWDCGEAVGGSPAPRTGPGRGRSSRRHGAVTTARLPRTQAMGGRGQALFPSLTMTQTPLPFFLGQQGPYDICEDTTSPTNTLFVGEFVLSSWDAKSPTARVLGEAGLGCTWVVSPQSQALSQWGIWGNSELRAQNRKLLSFILYHLQIHQL